MDQSRTKPNIKNLHHQNIASTSKMTKKNERLLEDPERNGSILTMKKWKSYTLKPNEEWMKLLADKLLSIASVRLLYLTIFDDLVKIPKEHTKLMRGCRLATLFAHVYIT